MTMIGMKISINYRIVVKLNTLSLHELMFLTFFSSVSIFDTLGKIWTRYINRKMKNETWNHVWLLLYLLISSRIWDALITAWNSMWMNFSTIKRWYVYDINCIILCKFMENRNIMILFDDNSKTKLFSIIIDFSFF